MKTFDVHQSPIELRGLLPSFHRLPDDIIDKVNEGVTGLALHSAGGRIRFATDSPKIILNYTLLSGGMMSHMPLTGQSGADFFVDGKFRAVLYPDGSVNVAQGGEFYTGGGWHEIEFNLPLYNGVTEVKISIEDSSEIFTPRPYKYEKPIVFYGSSITQGGCASRPGNCYTSIVSRRLDADHINLGFSGSARGEQIIADYIAGLSMSAFVLDYDHNAPSADHLKATHSSFYKTIRAAQPALPIVMMTKPDFDNGVEDNTKRRAIVLESYVNALADGDKHVYFCDGKAFFGNIERDACTVDGCHPNDLGFRFMADAVERELRAEMP